MRLTISYSAACWQVALPQPRGAAVAPENDVNVNNGVLLPAPRAQLRRVERRTRRLWRRRRLLPVLSGRRPRVLGHVPRRDDGLPAPRSTGPRLVRRFRRRRVRLVRGASQRRLAESLDCRLAGGRDASVVGLRLCVAIGASDRGVGDDARVASAPRVLEARAWPRAGADARAGDGEASRSFLESVVENRVIFRTSTLTGFSTQVA